MHQKARAFIERTAVFAVAVIDLCERLPPSLAARRIAPQLVDAANSVNSNYRATCRARSRAEFIAKIGVACEEADECVGWLELLVRSGTVPSQTAAPLLREANELTAILAASRKTACNNRRRT